MCQHTPPSFYTGLTALGNMGTWEGRQCESSRRLSEFPVMHTWVPLHCCFGLSDKSCFFQWLVSKELKPWPESCPLSSVHLHDLILRAAQVWRLLSSQLLPRKGVMLDFYVTLQDFFSRSYRILFSLWRFSRRVILDLWALIPLLSWQCKFKPAGIYSRFIYLSVRWGLQDCFHNSYVPFIFQMAVKKVHIP